MIYLDAAATTPLDPRILPLFAQYLGPEGLFSNPSSAHPWGRAAAHAIENARQHVADLIGAAPRDIVWTSGATESNNLALFGLMRTLSHRRHLITTQMEHKAILDVCGRLQREGCAVTFLAPDAHGIIAPEQVSAALRPDTGLISIMHVNNETGAVQDIAAIGALAREAGAFFHVDAAQSAGKLPIDVRSMPIDLLSISAHKCHGPKGIGALYMRQRPRKVRLEPLLFGGGQERGLRAGTLATHQIVAMGEAFRLAREGFDSDTVRMRALRQQLLEGLFLMGDVVCNGHPAQCAPHILNLSFLGIAAEALLADMPGIALSTGPACTSASHEPSHVLRAMGYDAGRMRAAVRFSLHRFTTAIEIAKTIQQATQSVRRLREISPLWPLTNTRTVPTDNGVLPDNRQYSAIP